MDIAIGCLDEVKEKVDRLRQLIDHHNLDGVLLRRVSSFAWATGGAASYVNTAVAEGAASLWITPTGMHLFTNNIEAPRLISEEGLLDQGWELHVSPWWDPQAALSSVLPGLHFGADVSFPGATDLSGSLARLRAALTPQEGQRARNAARLCAEALTAAAYAIYPGMTEIEIAAHIGAQALARGVQPVVNLVATDERMHLFRHPLPATKALERYALLVLSGRQAGLVISISRLVHFGPVPEDLQRRARATAAVLDVLESSTRPGQRVDAVLEKAQAAYAQQGFDGEWRNHHQGGAAGYEPRELLATPNSREEIAVGQLYAWNPSLPGAKSEDTFLVGIDKNEVLTFTPEWPQFDVQREGETGLASWPGILVR